MIEHGVGSRWSMMVLGAALTFAGLAGCNSGTDALEEGRLGAQASIERPSGEPQQVVQHNLAGASRAAGAESPVVGQLSAAGVGRARVEPRSGVRNGGEPITAKHLEAELNRLEAELGH